MVGEIKFGKNAKILIMVIEFQKVWRLVKFIQVFSRQMFVLHIR